MRFGNLGLRGANFFHCDLSGSSLVFAYLAGADLSYATLVGCSLPSGKRIRGASIHGKALLGYRPLYTLGPIGSREGFLQVYNTRGATYVKAGCFFGTLAKFEKAVNERHGRRVHGQEYRAAIRLLKKMEKLWKKKR